MSRTTAKQRTAQNSTLKRWIDQRRLHMRVWWLQMRKRSTDVSLWSTVMVMLSVSVGGASSAGAVWMTSDFMYPADENFAAWKSLAVELGKVAHKFVPVPIQELAVPEDYKKFSAWLKGIRTGEDIVVREQLLAAIVSSLGGGSAETTLMAKLIASGAEVMAKLTEVEKALRSASASLGSRPPGSVEGSVLERLGSIETSSASLASSANTHNIIIGQYKGSLYAMKGALVPTEDEWNTVSSRGAYPTSAEDALDKVSALLGGDTTKSIYERLEALITLAGTATFDPDATAGNPTVMNRLDLIAQALRGRGGTEDIMTCLRHLSARANEDATAIYGTPACESLKRLQDALGSDQPAITIVRSNNKAMGAGDNLTTTLATLQGQLTGIPGADIADKLETLRVAIYNLLVESGSAATPSELRPEDSLKKLTGYFGDYVSQYYYSE